MPTFNETRALPFKKFKAEKGIVMTNWSKSFPIFMSNSSVSAIQKQPINLNFRIFLKSNRRSGGYFQWNVCTNFLKIYSRTSYRNTKLIKNISNLLIVLLHFRFRQATLKSKFCEFFLPLIDPLTLLSMKCVHRLPENL